MKQNKKKQQREPSPISRLDKKLIAEVSMMLDLGISIDDIVIKYKLSYRQVKYISKNKISINDIVEVDENVRKSK